MRTEVSVKTTVTVDLKDFHTQDLIDELEERGHIVDSDCADELKTWDLLVALSKREYTEQFAQVPLTVLIKSLKHFGCPESFIQQLLEWDKEPIPTPAKLEKWRASCAVSAHE